MGESNDYKFLQVLGNGTFGVVKRALHIPTNKHVAIKIYPKSNISSDDDLKSFFNEYEIGRKFNHPFIVKTYDLFETDTSYNLVMELLEGDSLLSLINSYGALPPIKSQKIFCQLVAALEFLHLHGIAHRDLKPENILFDKNDQIRLIDFGLSKKGSLEMMSTRCGTVSYAAPELFVEAPYGKETEIWSLGVILYAMIYGFLPFDHENLSTLLQLITQSEPCYTSNVPADCIDLMKKLLKKSPKDRLTIEQIKKHSWFFFVEWSLFEFTDDDYFSISKCEKVVEAVSKAKEGKTLGRKQGEIVYDIICREHLLNEFVTRKTGKNPMNTKAKITSKTSSFPLYLFSIEHVSVRKNKKSPKPPNRIVVPDVNSSRVQQTRRSKSIHI